MARRTDRVNELLRNEISNLLTRQIKDPRLDGVISITRVNASNDLRSARVYVSVMGGAETKQLALDGIQSAAAYLRRELRHRVNLRHTPFLTFDLDESMEEGEQILRLMDSLKSDEAGLEPETASPDTASPDISAPAPSGG